MLKVWYQHAAKATRLPTLTCGTPFLGVVMAEREITASEGEEAAEWLLAAGGQAFLVWGSAASSWDGFLSRETRGAATESPTVVTQWHERETLDGVFSCAHRTAAAHNPSLDFCGIIDFHDQPRERLLVDQFHLSQFWG